MKKLIYITLILLLASVRLNAAVDSEALFNYITKDYTINEDGSYSVKVTKDLTLHTHTSFNSLYGETFVVYNPQREVLTIDKCYTTRPDGSVVEAPENAFNPVLPSVAANAPAYNHLVEMVITHTALELGATIHLEYTLTTKPSDNGQTYFDILEQIEERSPIKEYTISITAPQSQGLRYQLLRSGVKPQKSGDKLTFKFKNIAASSVESLKPAAGTSALLHATTMPADFVANKFGSREYCQCGTIDALRDELALGETNQEKAVSVLEYINHRLASSRLPFALQDNKERCMCKVTKSGYGTYIEKVMLLRAILSSANIPFQMVVTPSCGVSMDMLTFNTLGSVLFDIDGKLYSVDSTEPVDISSKAEVLSCYAIKESGMVEQYATAAAKPVVNSYSETITKDMAADNGYIIFSPEAINSGVRGWGIGSLPSKRIAAVELPEVANESSEWSITLEDGISLETPEFSKNISAPFGQLSLSLTKSGDKVVLKRSITFTRQTISVKEYAKFKEFIDCYSSNRYAKLLFEVK